MEADKAIDELQLKTGELQSIVEELKQQPDEFDIDSSIQGTNVVFNQLSFVITIAINILPCLVHIQMLYHFIIFDFNIVIILCI